MLSDMLKGVKKKQDERSNGEQPISGDVPKFNKTHGTFSPKTENRHIGSQKR